MKWIDARQKYPNTWVLFEAIESYSVEGQRIVKDLSIIDAYEDGEEAFQKYAIIHKKEPARELYIFHTKHEELDIKERMLVR